MNDKEKQINISTKEEIETRNKTGKEKDELKQALLHYATAEASGGIKTLIDCEGCAFYLYEILGYRKPTEDSVVLTKEEFEKFKMIENTIKRFSTISPTEAESENKALKEEIAIILAQKRNIWNSYNQLKQNMEWEIDKKVEEELDRVDKEARKETAEKILCKICELLLSIRKQDFEDSVPYYFENVEEFDERLYELAKQYSVEVGEEK